MLEFQIEEAIAKIFPKKVVVEHAPIKDYMQSLLPEEHSYIRNSVQKRKNEYSTARFLSRKALNQFGVQDAPILSDSKRAPIFPPGYIGSISHNDEICMAALAEKKMFKSIGIDVETVGQISAEMYPLIFTSNETKFIKSMSGYQDVWATLIFSAKESFYKYQYTMFKEWIDYDEAEIIPANNSFKIQPVSSKVDEIISNVNYIGKYFSFENLVFTCIY